MRSVASIVAFVCAAAVLGRGDLGAQAAADPCRHPDIVRYRERGEAMKFTVLYDGAAALARAPRTAIPYPGIIPENSCILLSVLFSEREGTVFVQDAGTMASVGPGLAMQLRRADYARQVVSAATQVVRDALQQDVFRLRPKGGQRYIVAVPVVRGHPLYATTTQPRVAAAGTASAAPSARRAPSSLRDRGFPGSALLQEDGEVALYHLGERNGRRYLALVRPVAPDEPILDYVATTLPDGTPIHRYGPAEDARFRSLILPHLRDTGQRFVEFTVYHYAAGVRIERQPDSRFPWNSERHFETSQPIEVPLAVESWTGRRPTNGGPFTWYSGTERGISATDLNTIAAIQTVQSGIAAQQAVYARNRAELQAREDRERAARHAALRAREAERQRLVIAAGLRYRSPQSWDRYTLGPELRRIYDGAWRGAASEWEFGLIFSRTIRSFSTRCRRLIPAGSPFVVQVWYTTDRAGNRWRTDDSDTTFIPAAFAEPFRWWDKNDPRALPLAPPSLSLRGVGDLMRLLQTLPTSMDGVFTATGLLVRTQIGARDDMALLFADGCEAPDLKQFMENMRRLALQLPTLQAERAPRALPTEAELPMSIAAACERHEQERGGQVSRRWCPCLQEQFSAVLTRGEQWNAVDDYHRFFDEVAGFRRATDGQPVWARYTPANACRN